ncbi:MAG: LysM peptidoglycan-binding domain-containing protein [Caldilineales bacterium]|nr:LysM peptidoglycan-binding domain-containing protein [Caldilineales bacterium]
MAFSPTRRLTIALIIVLLLMLATANAVSAHGGSLTTYVVKPGDTLASIGRQFCSTWQEIYSLNYMVIGPNPNYLQPGTVLKVPNNCWPGGDQPGWPPPGSCNNAYDHGPTAHAQGSVSGNQYWVIKGDTWYSISNRFGVPIPALQSANGMTTLYAGTVIVIPCLVAPPIEPPPPVANPVVAITSPQPGTVLPATFVVSGNGANLFEGNVVVRAVNQQGAILTEAATTLQGPNVGTGGQGTWSVQLTVNAPGGTTGSIQAFSPGTSAFSSVSVKYGQSSGGEITYTPGQCQIVIATGASAYTAPGGSVFGTFQANTQVDALKRQPSGGTNWYNFNLQVNGAPQSLWVTQESLVAASAGCAG